ncbi:hypothetical protein EI94DRAFT_1728540 [Lactarius quietus]|nr:hypothetical protein EI94DRAFT_1728540 [Lactarius quietus]
MRDGRIRSLVQPTILYIFLMSSRAQRMALRSVHCTIIEHRRCTWRPDPVRFFHQVHYVSKLRTPFFVVGENSLYRRRRSIWRVALLTVVGALALNTAATVLLTRASMANYPGGTALALLNERYADSPHVHVRISNLAVQSGASLFLHTHAPPYRERPGIFRPTTPSAVYHPWIYNKTENLMPADIAYSSTFTHVIAESRDALPGRCRIWVRRMEGRRDVLRLVRESGLRGFGVLEMKKAEKLCVFVTRVTSVLSISYRSYLFF